jgi:hypothetical protein
MMVLPLRVEKYLPPGTILPDQSSRAESYGVLASVHMCFQRAQLLGVCSSNLGVTMFRRLGLEIIHSMEDGRIFL